MCPFLVCLELPRKFAVSERRLVERCSVLSQRLFEQGLIGEFERRALRFYRWDYARNDEETHLNVLTLDRLQWVWIALIVADGVCIVVFLMERLLFAKCKF